MNDKNRKERFGNSSITTLQNVSSKVEERIGELGRGQIIADFLYHTKELNLSPEMVGRKFREF